MIKNAVKIKFSGSNLPKWLGTKRLGSLYVTMEESGLSGEERAEAASHCGPPMRRGVENYIKRNKLPNKKGKRQGKNENEKISTEDAIFMLFPFFKNLFWRRNFMHKYVEQSIHIRTPNTNTENFVNTHHICMIYQPLCLTKYTCYWNISLFGTEIRANLASIICVQSKNVSQPTVMFVYFYLLFLLFVPDRLGLRGTNLCC